MLLSAGVHLKEVGIFTDKWMHKVPLFLRAGTVNFLYFFFFFDCAVWLVASLFPNQGVNLGHIS